MNIYHLRMKAITFNGFHIFFAYSVTSTDQHGVGEYKIILTGHVN